MRKFLITSLRKLKKSFCLTTATFSLFFHVLSLLTYLKSALSKYDYDIISDCCWVYLLNRILWAIKYFTIIDRVFSFISCLNQFSTHQIISLKSSFQCNKSQVRKTREAYCETLWKNQNITCFAFCIRSRYSRAFNEMVVKREKEKITMRLITCNRSQFSDSLRNWLTAQSNHEIADFPKLQL